MYWLYPPFTKKGSSVHLYYKKLTYKITTMEQTDLWLSSLVTKNPQEGFELAIKLSRMGVKSTQSDVEVLKRLRIDYANNASGLTAASQVIALNFQTISAANNYWKNPE